MSDANQPFFALMGAPSSAATNDRHSFQAAIFAPDEPISLWYNAPGGAAVGIGVVDADAEGRLIYELPVARLGPGRYSLVAYG